MGKLGLGEGHPRHDVPVQPHRQPEQRVPDDEAGMVVGEMGELPAAQRRRRRVDARVRGPEPGRRRSRCDRGRCRPARGRDRRRWRGGRSPPGDGFAQASAHHRRRALRPRSWHPQRRGGRPRHCCAPRPLRVRASSRIAAHSASSRASGCAASSTVTALPRRRKAWASSRPIGPAPITTRCAGCVVRSNTVSLVR